MKTRSILFTKPLKELPNRIIWKSPDVSRVYDDVNGCKTYVHTYNMYDLQEKEFVATMKAGPVLYQNKHWQIYPMKAPYKSFYIAYIDSIESGMGYGTDFINLAKIESKRTGCEGRVHLTASRTFSPRRPPHIFYRKRNFVSVSEKMNKKMDYYISINQQLPWEYADNVEMYLPVEVKTPKAQSKISSIVNFFKEKFTKK